MAISPSLAPVPQRLGEVVRHRAQSQLGRPHRIVGLALGGVSPDQYYQRTDEEEDTAEGLVVGELSQGESG